MLTTMYLVRGRTGAHDEFTDWVVACYTDEEMANLHAQKANEHVHQDGNVIRLTDERVAKLATSNPFDSECFISSWTGTDYDVVPVKVYAHVDQYREEDPRGL